MNNLPCKINNLPEPVRWEDAVESLPFFLHSWVCWPHNSRLPTKLQQKHWINEKKKLEILAEKTKREPCNDIIRIILENRELGGQRWGLPLCIWDAEVSFCKRTSYKPLSKDYHSSQLTSQSNLCTLFNGDFSTLLLLQMLTKEGCEQINCYRPGT